MPTFGNDPSDVVTNSRGDVLAGVVLSLHASQADAVAKANVLASVTSDSLGRWVFTHASLTLVWVRTPSGAVFSVVDPTLSAGAASSAAATADAKAVAAQNTANVNTASIASKLASTDAQVVAAIAGPSASRASLNAAFVGRVGNGAAFLGDSNTASGDLALNMNLNWATMLPILSKGRIKWARNAGVGGNTTAQMLARLATDVLAYNPSYCFIMGGTNDATATAAQSGLAAIYTALRNAGVEPIACTIPPVNSDLGGKPNQINAWITAYCERNQIQALNFHDVLIDPLTGGFTVGLVGGDGVHLTDRGHRMVAEYALPLVLPRFPLWFPYVGASDPDSANLVPVPIFNLPRLLSDGTSTVPEDPRGWGTTTLATTGTRARLAVTGWPGQGQRITHPAGAVGTSSMSMMTNAGGNIWPIPVIAGHKYAWSIRLASTGCEANAAHPSISFAFTTNGSSDILTAGINGTMGGDVSDGVFYQEIVAPAGAIGARIGWQLIQPAAGASTATFTVGSPTVVDLTALGLT